jgi:methionyl-tRNA formyltransferase
MRIIFAGTPEVALPSLEAVRASGHELVAVLTREDAPVGRKRIMTPSAVALWAEEQRVPIVRANRITQSVLDDMNKFEAELGVVVAYGGLLPQAALELVPHGWINLHFSALPKWRGAAPVQWQLITGAESIGTSVFRLVRELDAGDIYSLEEHSVYPWETADALLERMADLGAQQLISVVNDIAQGVAKSHAQVGEITLAPKLRRADGHLDFSKSASEVFSRFRGVTSEPGAWIMVRGVSLKISGMSEVHESPWPPAGHFLLADKALWLGTGTHALRLDTVQPAGRLEMQAVDWFRGVTDPESACVNDI